MAEGPLTPCQCLVGIAAYHTKRMELSRSEWCERFVNALLALDESADLAEANRIAEVVYPSARLLVPEDAAAKLLGLVKPKDD